MMSSEDERDMLRIMECGNVPERAADSESVRGWRENNGDFLAWNNRANC